MESCQYSTQAVYHNVEIADQALDDDEGCGNSDCKDLLRPREMVKCAGLSCYTQVMNQHLL